MSVKSRWWSIIIYPESAVENWKDVLEQTHLQMAISPLHDKDTWNDDTEDHKKGDLKKPHHHVLIRYPNTTTWGPIKQIIARTKASSDIEAVFDPVGMERYHCHQDNPEKAQYNRIDETYLNGFKALNDWEETETSTMCNVIDYIIDNEITEFSTLINKLREDGNKDYLTWTLSKTHFITKYIDSLRYANVKFKEATDREDDRKAMYDKMCEMQNTIDDYESNYYALLETVQTLRKHVDLLQKDRGLFNENESKF